MGETVQGGLRSCAGCIRSPALWIGHLRWRMRTAAMSDGPLSREQIQERLLQSSFNAFLGLEVLTADPEKQEVVMRLKMRPEFERRRDTGQWHGGPIAAAIDTVGDYALAMLLGKTLPTVNFRVDYLRPSIRR